MVDDERLSLNKKRKGIKTRIVLEAARQGSRVISYETKNGLRSRCQGQIQTFIKISLAPRNSSSKPELRWTIVHPEGPCFLFNNETLKVCKRSISKQLDDLEAIEIILGCLWYSQSMETNLLQ